MNQVASRIASLLIAAACVFTLAWGGGASAAGPLEDHADALVAADVVEAAEGMWRQTLTAGVDDEPEGVGALLEDVSARLAGSPDAVAWEAIARRAEAMVEDGVDEPHVLAWYGEALLEAGDASAAEPHARRAERMLREGDDASALFRAMAAERMTRIAAALDDGEAVETYRERAAEAAVEALAAEWPEEALAQRAMLRWVRESVFDALSREKQEAFYERCVEREVDAWAAELLGGIAHHRLAEQITDEHGHGPLPLEVGIAFQRHMTDARGKLVKAHRARPDHPEAAAWLITLAARGYAPAETTPRDWFDRAAEAQLDYLPAYRRMIAALRPSRAGSREELLAFGVECLMTERFDTAVPRQLLHAVETAAEVLGGDFEGVFAEENVADNVLWMLERYRDEPGPAGRAARFDSLIAAVAWRAGRIERAGQALEAAGADVALAAFEQVGAVPERAVGEILAGTGQFAHVTRQLERTLEGGGHDRAVAEYDALAERHAGRPALARFFAHRARRARMVRDLAFGGEADIGPGEGLAGWSPMVGQWSVEADGTLVGRSDEKGLWIACDVPLGTSFEMTAEVEFVLDAGHEDPVAGIYFGHRAGEGFHTFLADHHSGSAQLNRGLWGGSEADAPVREVNRLRLVVRDRRVFASVNGRPVFSNESPRQLGDDAEARVGLGGRYGSAGAVVRFRNVRARRLERETIGVGPGGEEGVLAWVPDGFMVRWHD